MEFGCKWQKLVLKWWKLAINAITLIVNEGI